MNQTGNQWAADPVSGFVAPPLVGPHSHPPGDLLSMPTLAEVQALDARLDTAEAELNLIDSGAWTAWTPTWTGTLGNGTLVGRRAKVGRTVHFSVHLQWGSTTTHPASQQTFGLPFASTDVGYVPLGIALYENVGVSLDYGFGVQVSTTTFQCVNLAGTAASNISPFTWGNTDRLFVRATYEAAS